MVKIRGEVYWFSIRTKINLSSVYWLTGLLRILQHAFCIVEAYQRTEACRMARKGQLDRVEAIFQTVEKNPGRRPAEIAEELNLQRSEVTRYLPALEDQGFLLSEDDQGRLWPFPHKKA